MQSNKINITFILPSLAAGGAERVVSFVAQNINRDTFEPTLLICGYETQTTYDVKNIRVIYLNKSRVLTAIPGLLKYVLTKRPHIIMSAIGHINTVMAYLSFLAPKTKFIAREVNILSILKDYELKTTNFGSIFSINRFKYFDAIVCQSNDMKNDLMQNYKLNADKLIIINNPITDDFRLSHLERRKDIVLKFITVARLKKQKGHERIINALSKLSFPFHYTIIGDGPEYENIFSQLKYLGLNSKISHIKNTKEVYKHLSDQDVYLQGSFIEGFPNAVIESSAVGTPILAFNAPGGINEIIEDAVNGYIVDNEDAFIKCLEDINTRYPFNPKDVSKSVTKKYSKTIIIKRYEELFMKLINAK